MCTSGIIRTFFKFTQYDITRTVSHRIYRKFGLSVFKMTKWCGNPRIVTAMNIADIAKFLVTLI